MKTNNVNVVERAGVRGDLFENIGSGFNRVVENVKNVSPRVVAGLVISGGMRVVSAGDGAPSVGTRIIYGGGSICVVGAILIIIGLCCRACETSQSFDSDMITQYQSSSCFRNGTFLMFAGGGTIAIGFVIALLGSIVALL